MDADGDFRFILFASGLIVVIALVLCLLFLPDTRSWALIEAEEHEHSAGAPSNVFFHTTIKNRDLRKISFGGMVNMVFFGPYSLLFFYPSIPPTQL